MERIQSEDKDDSYVEVILLNSNPTIAPMSSNIIPCRWQKLIRLILDQMNLNFGDKADL